MDGWIDGWMDGWMDEEGSNREHLRMSNSSS